MENRLVLTVGGQDRVGVVKTVSNAVFRNGGNLEQSRMARLGGEFVGILLIRAGDEHLDDLMADLMNLEKLGLKVYVRLLDETSIERLKGFVPHQVVVKGADHEGILHRVSDELADAGVNIEELTTEVANAPNTGTSLFTMTATVAIPPGMTTQMLRDHMNRVAEKMGLDTEVRMSIG